MALDNKIITGRELKDSKARILENQKVKRRGGRRFNFNYIKNILGLLIFSGIVSYFCYNNLISDAISERKLKEAYNKTLAQYADIDGNDVISDVEKKDFYYKILKGKNVLYDVDKWPRYSDGRDVSLEDMTKWIEEYKP